MLYKGMFSLFVVPLLQEVASYANTLHFSIGLLLTMIVIIEKLTDTSTCQSSEQTEVQRIFFCCIQATVNLNKC